LASGDSAAGSIEYVPYLARVNGNPQLPSCIHPEDLPALVQDLGSTRMNSDINAEIEVRAGYGLPQIAEVELADKSWVIRARGLVVDGFAKLRSLFSRILGKPQEPVAKIQLPEVAVQDEDYDPFEFLGQIVVENEFTRAHAEMTAREKAHQAATERESAKVREQPGLRATSPTFKRRF
jgi:hypothetical protein